MFLILSEDISLERVSRKRIWRKRGSSVVRHLPLVLEVPGSIRKISVSEHAFPSVICRDDT